MRLRGLLFGIFSVLIGTALLVLPFVVALPVVFACAVGLGLTTGRRRWLPRRSA